VIVDLLRAGLGQGLVVPHPGFPRSFASAYIKSAKEQCLLLTVVGRADTVRIGECSAV
jgi:hypothetical protein